MPLFSHTRRTKARVRKTLKRKQHGGAPCPAVGPRRGQLQIRWYASFPAWSIAKINYKLASAFVEPEPEDLVSTASSGYLIYYETAHNAGEIKQHVVGFLVIKTSDGTHPECWYIDWVLVDEACRGKGLGTTLTKNIIAKAKELGKSCIKLNVLAQSSTQQMYAAAGFVNTGAFKMVPGSEGTNVRMEEMRIDL